MINKVVLVGCGYWGKNWYNTLSKIHNVKVVAVIDPNPAIPILEHESSLESFIEKNYDYDYVIIAAQAEYHKLYVEYFKSTIGAENILVEKPCGLLTEPREFYYNCFPGYLFLSTPHYKKIKSMIKERMLGSILYTQFSRASMGPRIRTDVSIIEDYMIHDLYIYQDLFQYKQNDLAVEVDLDTNLGSEIKANTATVRIRNKNNNHRSTFFSSWIYPQKERKIVIVGTEGSIIWEGDKLYFTCSHYSKLEGKDKYGNKGWDLREHPTVDITPEEKKSTLELEFEDFLEQDPRLQIQKDLNELLKRVVFQ